jgi:hypothetical protein
VFGQDGVKQLCADLDIELLGTSRVGCYGWCNRIGAGELPLDVAIREGADSGSPIVLSQPNSAQVGCSACMQIIAQTSNIRCFRRWYTIVLQLACVSNWV